MTPSGVARLQIPSICRKDIKHEDLFSNAEGTHRVQQCDVGGGVNDVVLLGCCMMWKLEESGNESEGLAHFKCSVIK